MQEYQYAGFWIRVGAMLIDVVILTIIIGIALVLVYGPQSFSDDTARQGIWGFLLNYVFPFAATIWFWQKFLGTPGKMALKLKIVDAKTGQKPSMGQSIGRYFAYILSALPFCLGYIWVAFDTKKQSWHDKLAGTVVIRDTRTEPVTFGEDA